MTTTGKRAEFARDLLGSDFFQETIQFMNEDVVQRIAATDPLDTNTLTVLRLELGAISEFAQRLAQFIDEHEAVEFERYKEEQARLEEQRGFA